MLDNDKLYNEFVKTLKTKFNTKNQNIIFLCIGTNRIIGDCFGPLVGSRLKNLLKERKNIKIIGDMNFPVNSRNIYKTLRLINYKYKDSYIVAIDSAISDFDIIGNIFVTDNGINLASGINKSLIKIGDIGIKACVGSKNKDKNENIKVLGNVSKTFIDNLSNVVSLGIQEVCFNN